MPGHKVQEDVTRAGGLEKTPNLCLGAKVMLKKNKDVEAGLVNGSTDTLVRLEIMLAVRQYRLDRTVSK